MNNKSKYILVFFILSIIFGLLLSLQNSKETENYSLVSLSSIEMMKNEIEESKSDMEKLNQLIDEKNNNLKQ